MKMKKTLASLALVAVAFASTSAMADQVPFTVNETGIPGVSNWDTIVGATGSFTANNMGGKYDEQVGLNGDGTFSASAIGTFAAYYNNATQIGSDKSALGAPESLGGYKLYAVFTASGNATSNTTFAGTSGTLNIYVDTGSNTSCSITSFTTAATCAGNGDDLLVGTSTTSYGTGDLVGPPGAFNIYFSNFALTSFGQTYWTGIDTLQFTLQTNGDIDIVTPDPTTGGLPPYSIHGDFSANFASVVPEPASLALVGVALLGLGAVTRRRNRKD
ncbi:flocculation-associated PEP-CTERM protein PepA [Paucibacter sp. R3-3]|uniref:Flocculation-associated PEP-CTERM protein PepA n=1 Tax=Roseateles agri TaxID=3098619 RepID=A0ABU5DLQ8_9BURK|nr:flocculation-associated PEP-CTERM protein PepA [Paucibacter sp. R3-3]MDY0747227.1 flocculation-associated PEP-CTERM protein PepA [Paucibacter sp. R3-3]